MMFSPSPAVFAQSLACRKLLKELLIAEMVEERGAVLYGAQSRRAGGQEDKACDVTKPGTRGGRREDAEAISRMSSRT